MYALQRTDVRPGLLQGYMHRVKLYQQLPELWQAEDIFPVMLG